MSEVLMSEVFTRAYHNGIQIVAEFRQAVVSYDGDGNPRWGFVLGERSLRERIENRKECGLPVLEEIAALSAIERMKHGETEQSS